MTTLHYHMPSNLEEVDPIVLTLKAAVDAWLEPEAVFRFQLCLSEALSNLILHSNASALGTRNGIHLQRADDGVELRIFDPIGAAPFDVTENGVPLGSVEPTAEGGRGLGLILDCADAVSYGPRGERNCLSLNFLNRA